MKSEQSWSYFPHLLGVALVIVLALWALHEPEEPPPEPKHLEYMP